VRRGPRGPLSGGTLRAALACFLLWGVSACRADPQYRPDDVLKRELGLTDRDEVHRIVITGGASERAEPAAITVRPGVWVDFYSGDHRIHTVAFEMDSLDVAQAAFLHRTGQEASPPLVDLASRFVVTLEGAPQGRYPFLLEGNTAPGRGAVIVRGKGR